MEGVVTAAGEPRSGETCLPSYYSRFAVVVVAAIVAAVVVYVGDKTDRKSVDAASAC